MGIIELRRLTLVLLEIFVSDKIQNYFAKTVLCLLYLLANASVKPYKSLYLNIISAISLSSQLIVGLCSLLFAVKDESTSDMIPSMMFVLYLEELSGIPMPFFLSVICASPFVYKSIQKSQDHPNIIYRKKQLARQYCKTYYHKKITNA